jgi:methionyl-tRNA formyltransferase
VSQPDRPAGRGKQLTEPAVKVAARALGLRVLQPERVRTPELEAELRALAADVFVVVAYGRILPQALLDVPRCGAWNVHGSLLPKLRGAAPIQWAIIRGEIVTGVAVMRMEAGLDTGPVAAVREVPIVDADTTATLAEKLARRARPCSSRTLPAILDGTVRLAPQDDAAATLAPPLVKEDGRLRFDADARVVSARARGVGPVAGRDGAARRRGDARLRSERAFRAGRAGRAEFSGAGVVMGAWTRGSDRRLLQQHGRGVRRAAAPRPQAACLRLPVLAGRPIPPVRRCRIRRRGRGD